MMTHHPECPCHEMGCPSVREGRSERQKRVAEASKPDRLKAIARDILFDVEHYQKHGSLGDLG